MMSLKSKGMKIGLIDLQVKRTGLSGCEALDSEGDLPFPARTQSLTLADCTAQATSDKADEEAPNQQVAKRRMGFFPLRKTP